MVHWADVGVYWSRVQATLHGKLDRKKHIYYLILPILTSNRRWLSLSPLSKANYSEFSVH